MNWQFADILSDQLQVFGISILYGFLSGAFYGIFRVLRKVFTHKDAFVHIEDILYCIIQTLGMFFITQIFNYGMIRMYIILGILCGAILYFYFIGTQIEKILAKLLHTFFSFLQCFLHTILKPYKIIITFFLKALKKMKRTVKIVRSNQ